MDPLSPGLLLQAYQLGAFPMGDERGRILWFSPDPRCVFELDQFSVPRSLRPVLNAERFQIRVSTYFREVMEACADRSEGTWITDEIVDVYCTLHEAGFAHSVETWRDGRLVGGLYGVSIGGAFFGESMFHRETDASKVALVALVRRLRERGYTLLDTQWSTPHLRRFGAVEISRAAYLRRLKVALERECTFLDEASAGGD